MRVRVRGWGEGQGESEGQGEGQGEGEGAGQGWVACLRSMAASPSADWKAAASEARTAVRASSRWPATWVARSVKHL